MKIKKIVFIIIGCISFSLGSIGVVLPILPTVPFYLVAAYCFGRSSKKLNDWFKGTKLYENNLESFVEKKGMTKKTKKRIITSVTILMGIGFFMMDKVVVGRIVLLIVWIFHMLYFLFCVKTIEEE